VYEQAAHLDRRYRLGLRSGWWEDDVQVELLATLGAWVAMFDYANWTDPEGKTRLILGLPAIRELLRGGAQQFDPERDREAFEQHVRDHPGCRQPDDVR
jgi:myo-inositol catabolism protein IolC